MYEFVLGSEHDCTMYNVLQGRTEMSGMLLCTYVVQGGEIHTCMCSVWGQFSFSEECIQMDSNVQERPHSAQDA